MSSLIAWILRAIPFGTIIMYGALGETLTEKSGNLNLGVPGIMYLGGFAGFASAYYYEKLSANPSAFVCVILALLCALIASALGGLIYAFLTITLRANQNVTGLALTTFRSRLPYQNQPSAGSACCRPRSRRTAACHGIPRRGSCAARDSPTAQPSCPPSLPAYRTWRCPKRRRAPYRPP